MKRTALGALLLFITSAALAEGSKRYLVATKSPARVTSLASLSQELRDPAAHRVKKFGIVDAFAADLTEAEVAALRQSPEVRWVEPVVSRQLFASVSRPGEQMIPYGVAQVRAPETWSARRSSMVNVAVIDSGVDFRHPELSGAWAGGTNIAINGQPPLDTMGHGTHVSGIVAAADNAFGVVGVAPSVRLWGIKVVDDNGNVTVEDVLEGLEWVSAKKAQLGGRWVVNLSLGGEEQSDIEREAFRKAVDEGMMIVAATGNGSAPNAPKPVAFPAAYPGVIAVGAIDENQIHAPFSNQGPEVAFVASGVRVTSTFVTGTATMSYVRAGSRVLAARAMVGSRLGSITAPYVNCGLGEAKDFTSAVQGKIALIKRGGESFATKTRRAMQAGAVAVVIFNRDDSPYLFTLIDPEDPTTKDEKWPIAVGMPMADGESLIAAGSGTITIAYEPDDYDSKSGTSMSSPHVAGAVALLWSIGPSLTPQQLMAGLVVTAKDLGDPGKDEKYGFGEIDLFAAAKLLVPEAFSGSSGTTGRKFVSRRRR